MQRHSFYGVLILLLFQQQKGIWYEKEPAMLSPEVCYWVLGPMWGSREMSLVKQRPVSVLRDLVMLIQFCNA